MDLMTMLNVIQTQFPDALPILQQPGVAAVYVAYLNSGSSPDNPPWTKAQLEAALRATPYYQNTPKATRDFNIDQATDPATARTKGAATKRLFDDISHQIGLTAPPDFNLFARAVSEGWDANRIKYELIATTNWGGGLYPQGGEIGASAAKVNSLANEYGVPLSDMTKVQWGRQLAQGAIDEQGLQGYLIEQAKSLFPALSDALDRGITVKQYAQPYLQLAQQELDIDPNTVNLTDQKWMSALNQVDPKTGQRVSMSLDSWLSKIRSDPAYGYDTTAQGRNSATQLAAALQQKMGSAA
jgi:hypothetical protein